MRRSFRIVAFSLGVSADQGPQFSRVMRAKLERRYGCSTSQHKRIGHPHAAVTEITGELSTVP